ncbi:hypothetical protein [Arcobacter sp. CECT 8985]|uniref:hypothetical protein n=1 Tax=Arcobacter sp. CECT 8985 TaxID=1935424 RepID=UPI00100BE416|nr:hypothetical protein [Arcobacter sp. CECT 8985]RXJ88086.1 hypothetical protein CRU93_00375 [Arcobacter sp. CECT 8985]
MLKNKVYSPMQGALGGFLGGPLASLYFIKQNYSALNNDEGMSKTLLLGGVVIFVLLVVLPFLPEKFPNMAIPIATIITTRLIIEKYQFSKEDILSNEELSFQSNWKVFWVSLLSLVILIMLFLSIMFLLDLLGIINFIY